jgi:hypothetical protein
MTPDATCTVGRTSVNVTVRRSGITSRFTVIKVPSTVSWNAISFPRNARLVRLSSYWSSGTPAMLVLLKLTRPRELLSSNRFACPSLPAVGVLPSVIIGSPLPPFRDADAAAGAAASHFAIAGSPCIAGGAGIGGLEHHRARR